MVAASGALSREQIVTALNVLHQDSEAYWQSLRTEQFLAAIGSAWSPAENVRHLTKSVRAVTRGLRLPRWLLALRFGSAKAPSRTLEVLLAAYRERLARGASAGRFAPSERLPSPDPDGQRREIMDRHRIAIRALCEAVAKWPERALDRRVLPHPALGTLTVREMLYFTIFHNRHHLELVQRRLGASGDASGTT